MELAGADVAPAVQGASSIQTCYTACLGQGACAAFTWAPGGRTCALKDISGWVLRPSPGSQSVVICPERFPFPDDPPSPPAGPTRRLLAEAPGVEADLGGLGLLRRLLGQAAAAQQAGSQNGEAPAPKGKAAWALQLRRLRGERQPWQHDAHPGGPPAGSGGVGSGDDEFVVAASASVAPYLPLLLPPCTLGEDINFVGALMGTDQCTSKGWLIQPLDDGQGSPLPTDLYAEQRLARLTAGTPPSGAERPSPRAAAGACASNVSAAGAAQCWTLAYDQCISGFASRAHLPRYVVLGEPGVLASLFSAAASSGAFGSPAVQPAQYSRVCLADPATAGSAACKSVAKNDVLVQVAGARPASYGPCDYQPGTVYAVSAALNGAGQLEGWAAGTPAAG